MTLGLLLIFLLLSTFFLLPVLREYFVTSRTIYSHEIKGLL